MADCCPIAPYLPSIWDPHRQAEPVSTFWASDLESVSVVFRHRAQGADRYATKVLRERFGVRSRQCRNLDTDPI